MEDRIRETLVGLLAAIERADSDAIAGAAARLDDYVAQARGALDPRLAHFLERRSYPKALQLLGGERGIPAGSCGGGR